MRTTDTGWPARATSIPRLVVALSVMALAGAFAPGVSAQQPDEATDVSRMPRVTLSWTEAPLRDVLHAFAAYSGRSIVAGSGVEGVFVSADIRNQPWDLALEAILESRGLRATENEAGIISVETYADLRARERMEPLVTRSYRIAYSRAAELRSAIAPLLSERGSLSVMESANTLVVSDVERVHRVVKGLVEG